MPAGFGGRLRGKGPHPHRERDLAAQPTLSLPIRLVFSWYAMALGSVITSLEVFE